MHNKPAVGSNLVGSKLRPACAEGREGAGGETTGVQERQRLGVVVKKVNFLLCCGGGHWRVLTRE